MTVSQIQYVAVVQNLLVRSISLYSNCAPPELVLALIFGKTTLLLGQLDGCKSSLNALFRNVPRVS